jgi:hypothetical protein
MYEREVDYVDNTASVSLHFIICLKMKYVPIYPVLAILKRFYD